jgi:uncharacterized membrane protein YkoI
MERKRRLILTVGGAAAAVAVVAGAGVAAASAGDDDGDGDELSGDAFDRASEAAVEAAGGGEVTSAESDDDGGTVAYEVEVRLDDGTEVDVDLDADFGVLSTADEGRDDDGDDANDDKALTGDTLDEASTAAVEEAGGGQVTDSEASDDGGDGAYEVEVTRDDGTEVDVDLDESFKVLSATEDGANDDNDANDD